MNGLHVNIYALRIGTVQLRVYIFVQWKFVWEKTGKWYHSIELAESFLLQTSQLALPERNFERPTLLL